MQNVNGVGVTQFSGMKPKQKITIGGVDWSLRRDATDSSMVFPHQKVNWLNAGCETLDGNIYYCWIMGVIAPTMGSIERPVNVMYIGFHSQRILIAPNSVTQADLDRMHVYISDSSGFVGEFVGKFLGIESDHPIEEREKISPWPTSSTQQADTKQPEVEIKENDKK